ncbi:MAG: tetratricopeptide repeat protein, partial [Adhaeribacter sp.]
MRSMAFIRLALCLCLLSGAGAGPLWAQTDEVALAKQYYQKQEYEKANALFEKLSNNNQFFANVYPEYLRSLQAIKDFKEAEKLVKKAIKKNEGQIVYQIDLGKVYQLSGREEQATKHFNKMIEQLESRDVLAAAAAFEEQGLPELAEKAYLQGRKLSKNEFDFTGQLMQLYANQRQSEKLINEILSIARNNPNHLAVAQNMLQNTLKEEKEFDILEKALISNLQKFPDQVVYSELLVWLYTQRKDFFSALMQARSLDKRTKGGGTRLMELGAIALKNKDYESAIESYTYVVKEYRNGPFYEVA